MFIHMLGIIIFCNCKKSKNPTKSFLSSKCSAFLAVMEQIHLGLRSSGVQLIFPIIVIIDPLSPRRLSDWWVALGGTDRCNKSVHILFSFSCPSYIYLPRSKEDNTFGSVRPSIRLCVWVCERLHYVCAVEWLIYD